MKFVFAIAALALATGRCYAQSQNQVHRFIIAIRTSENVVSDNDILGTGGTIPPGMVLKYVNSGDKSVTAAVGNVQFTMNIADFRWVYADKEADAEKQYFDEIESLNAKISELAKQQEDEQAQAKQKERDEATQREEADQKLIQLMELGQAERAHHSTGGSQDNVLRMQVLQDEQRQQMQNLFNQN